MFPAGCLALALAGAVACFIGQDDGSIKMTCSDLPIPNIESCKEQFANFDIPNPENPEPFFFNNQAR